MTSGRPTFALAIICHERPNELATALGSVADEVWDEILVLDMASDPPLAPIDGINWLRFDENLGVAEGRNRLAKAATADVLVFLDDDAVSLTEVVAPLVDIFSAHPDLAVAAFQITRADGTSVKSEFPFRGRVRHPDAARACAYFLGGAAAIRRDPMLAVGGYESSFFYSTEEVDLALKLLRRGWTLRYTPHVVIEHRPSTSGRRLMPQVPARRLENRLVLVRRHLPWPVAVVHGAVWAARTMVEAARAGSIEAWRSGMRAGLKRHVDREPLSYKQLAHIHRIGGRVLW